METRPYTNSRFTMQSSWQFEVTQAFRQVEDLLAFLELDVGDFALSNPTFPVLVTRSFADRMVIGDPKDPLLLQVLPLSLELDKLPGFSTDPVSDLDSTLVPGLLQKYRHRALVITTGACAIHCRYCFRRDFPYQEQQTTKSRWQMQLETLRMDESIEEVILSGGDPLMLSNDRLLEVLTDLSAIPHIARIRIHSRIPIVLPDRIDPGLIECLQSARQPIIMVIHSNHPNELNLTVNQALERIHQTGATLLNQAVLLRGINDDADTLTELSKKLFAAKVIPYYLHALDRATGTGHFEVDQEAGKQLIDVIRQALPGYLVPKLVREIAGEGSKTPLV